MEGLGENGISNFAPKNCEFLPASMPEIQNSKFGQTLNSGFQYSEGLMESLNLALDCFALHHYIVFHSMNLVATPFNVSHLMPSEALPCPPLHCTLYTCSLYPTLPCPTFLYSPYTQLLTFFIHEI